MNQPNHDPAQEVSDWVRRWSHLVPPGGSVLDVACGHGRHLRWFARRGHAVTGIDRAGEALAALAALGQTIQADIENGPWPLLQDGQPRQFNAVVVTNYLWRPLWPTLLGSLAQGGVLIYETFCAGQESVGKPTNPQFLLHNGELLQVCAGLRVVAYEDGCLSQPQRFVQRIVAVRPTSAHPVASAVMRLPPPRYALHSQPATATGHDC